MTITHIVMCSFKEDTPAETIDKMVAGLLALKDTCFHPTTKKAYLKTSIGGKQSSLLGIDGGFTHIFIEEFENKEDLTYFLEKDETHQAYSKVLMPVIEKALVVDFTSGGF